MRWQVSNDDIRSEFVRSNYVNNKDNYNFVVYDYSSYEGMPDGGFFGNTKFISDNESYLGTDHSDKKTENFKFVKFN